MGLKHLSKNKVLKMTVRRYTDTMKEFSSEYEAPTGDPRLMHTWVSLGSMVVLGLMVVCGVLGLISLFSS